MELSHITWQQRPFRTCNFKVHGVPSLRQPQASVSSLHPRFSTLFRSSNTHSASLLLFAQTYQASIGSCIFVPYSFKPTSELVTSPTTLYTLVTGPHRQVHGSFPVELLRVTSSGFPTSFTKFATARCNPRMQLQGCHHPWCRHDSFWELTPVKWGSRSGLANILRLEDRDVHFLDVRWRC